MEQREIAHLFREEEPVKITAKNSSRGENDFREAPYVSVRGWDDFDKDDHFLRCIKKVLEISSEVYEFNALEKQAAPLLYRCIKPLYWHSTDLLKEAGEDDEKIQACLNFIEYEQTREIDFWDFGKMEL